jgi:hypothetical protein
MPSDNLRAITVEELTYSNMIQLQALIELLTEKGLLAQQEILDRIKSLGRKLRSSAGRNEGWRSWLGSVKTSRAHGHSGRTLGLPLELECHNKGRADVRATRSDD